MIHAMCHLSPVTCHMSPVTCQNIFFYILIFGQSGGTSWWRVYYQRGLPRLVHTKIHQNTYILKEPPIICIWWVFSCTLSGFKSLVCYCIYSNKEINAKCMYSNYEIYALVSGTNILNLSQIFRPNLKGQNTTLMNALIGSIFLNKNIPCHGTFKGLDPVFLISAMGSYANWAKWPP